MRSLARLGVAAATAALASATALAGAGVAAAQGLDIITNSPSSVSVSGTGASAKVTYTNRSGQDLSCNGFAGRSDLIGDMYQFARVSGTQGDPPPALMLRMATAMERGQIGLYAGMVEDGTSVDLAPILGQETGMGLTDSSFTPAAMVSCYGMGGESDYVEVEVSTGVGVPAVLGSLDGALAGIGSSGSVADITGSLGS